MKYEEVFGKHKMATMSKGNLKKNLELRGVYIDERDFDDLCRSFQSGANTVSMKDLRAKIRLIDPHFLDPNAPQSKEEAHHRVLLFPEHIQRDLLKISDYLKREKITTQKCFELMDVDKSGDVTIDEFSKYLGPRNTQLTSRNLKALFKALDKSGDGKLTIGEFLLYIDGATQTKEERMKEAKDNLRHGSVSDQIRY